MRVKIWSALLCVLLLSASVGVAHAAAPSKSIYGNNLSTPVTFAEGYGITGEAVDTATGLRGGTSRLTDNFAALQGVYQPFHMTGTSDAAGVPLWSSWFYEQKTVAAWQADWQSLADSDPAIDTCQVDFIDWGDSLLAQTWTTRSKIRVEVRLLRTNAEALQGYAMNHLSGSGITEVWGAADGSAVGASAPLWQGRTYVPDYGTVYSSCARISVYRLVDGVPEAAPVFSYAVADKYGTDGPGGFAAECNVGGWVIYGFNWDPRDNNLGPGQYRVQFSLDPSATWAGSTVSRNAHIKALNPADFGEWPYSPQLSADGYNSWVDVTLVSRSGGKRR